jgi:hypothetical protein
VYNIWVGDAERGLTFFCESPEAWNGKKDRQIELTRTDAAMVWKLNMVQEPWSNPDYRIEFGLHPTPMRARSRRILGLAYGSDAVLAWGQPQYTLYHGYPVAPEDMESIGLRPEQSIDALVARNHSAGKRVYSYLHVAMLSKHAPELAFFGPDWRVPGAQFNWVPDNFHVPHLEGRPPDWIYGMCPNSEWADFQVFLLHDYITKHRIDGVHFDFCSPWVCRNTNHGCRPDYMPIMAWREMLKRIYVMASRLPHPFQINQHTSINSGIMSSALLSFADTVVENENFSCWGSDFGKDAEWTMTKVPLEYYTVRLSGMPFGPRGVPIWHMGYDFGAVAAVTLLHDITTIWHYVGDPPKPDWQADWRRLHGKLSEFGVNDDGVAFLPYWNAPELVPAGDPESKVSYYLHPSNGILMVVANFSRDPREIEIRLEALPGNGEWDIRDVWNDRDVPTDGRRADVGVAGHNFALLHLFSEP